MEGEGRGLCGVTSSAHVFGTAGESSDHVLGHASFLHSRPIGAVPIHPQDFQATGPVFRSPTQNASSRTQQQALHTLQVLVEYAAQSFRLLALAVGELRHVTSEELAHMTQQDAEAMAGRMDMLGLLVLSNHLHPSSKETITSLQDK